MKRTIGLAIAALLMVSAPQVASAQQYYGSPGGYYGGNIQGRTVIIRRHVIIRHHHYFRPNFYGGYRGGNYGYMRPGDMMMGQPRRMWPSGSYGGSPYHYGRPGLPRGCHWQWNGARNYPDCSANDHPSLHIPGTRR